MSESIKIRTSASAHNDTIAREVREILGRTGATVLNMIGSPGSGKTSLLEAMGRRYGARLAVITGDIQMSYDAQRLKASGAQAVQIETGGTCHLTAGMVRDALGAVDLGIAEFLVIENVGNLVCPSTYDLGEDYKVAVLSVSEGDEKPAKYPALFVRAKSVVITKSDLLPYVNFNVDRASQDCKRLNAAAHVFVTSCTTGEGLEEWFSHLESTRSRRRAR